MQKQGALCGVKVLDLSRLLPGPYCSMILADHGAEVIAVEDGRFRADGLYFNDVNRNKRHMSLNLKCDEGREIFFRLAREADVLLEGFRPGVVERLGVDYAAVNAVNPGIIYCSITGYGQTGPKRDEPGHDVNYLSSAGILDLIGAAGGAPSIPAVQVADIAGGAMQAAIGILLALYAREKSGQGQYIDISMTDGILGLLTLPMFFERVQGERPARSETTLSHRFGCYNTYRTRDGRYLAVGAVENRFWKRLCETLGRPDYIDLQYDLGRRREIIDWLRTTFAEKSLADWDAMFNGVEACCSPVANLDEVLTSPLFCAREMVCEYPQTNGEVRRGLGIPVKLSGTPGTIRTAPAEFGQHTRDILRELGYQPQDIDELVLRRVI